VALELNGAFEMNDHHADVHAAAAQLRYGFLGVISPGMQFRSGLAAALSKATQWAFVDDPNARKPFGLAKAMFYRTALAREA
jgi:hypothetical protein